MKAPTPSFDPYRSPSLPEGPYEGVPAAGRPGLLTTLCVLCIVLGALGLMNSALGTAGAIGGSRLQAAIQPKTSAGLPPGMKQAQDDFQDDLNAVQRKYFWATVPALAFRFLAGLLLLIGGIRSLALSESGRKLLLVACAVALVFELGHAILQSVVSLEMMTAVNSYVEKLTSSMNQQNNAPPGFQKMMQTIVHGSILGGIIVSYLISLGKIALYVFGLIYLRTNPIRGLFGRSSLIPTQPLASDL
jgi:hypothetical protein